MKECELRCVVYVGTFRCVYDVDLCVLNFTVEVVHILILLG